ncbi:MAG: hydroxymethylbilane synthase [Candidatus Methanomethylophilus sp.]|nr:hydroxymethylbilane synthase [Methanomethylophilus sp.]
MIAGTRESNLAMAQTVEFKRRFEETYPGKTCEIKGITSTGDIDLKTHLKDMGGAGVFVRELDDALLRGDIDVTVNSLKDIPAVMDKRLVVAAVLPRADVRDACIPVPLETLEDGKILGTSSVRREKMLGENMPGVVLKPIRGNMNTRLNKLANGDYDAILMAKAGLDRLGISENVHPIPKDKFIPAAGQGAIAIECRADDTETIELLKKLDDRKTRTEVKAERDILRYMNAGCSSPIGINAEVLGDKMRIIAVTYVFKEPIKVDATFPLEEIESKTREIADILMNKRK